jgi:hypothetical protein
MTLSAERRIVTDRCQASRVGTACRAPTVKTSSSETLFLLLRLGRSGAWGWLLTEADFVGDEVGSRGFGVDYDAIAYF